ncbi:MAG TPA: thiamine pyrophosphate-binding protein [Hyphomicrobiaceae bacterium]|nr:thiamine pyrophosphate-binding protein [Hyphomicrobiaceae bacterium]
MTKTMRKPQGAETRGSAPAYQVLAEDIKALGVEAVFGLMSDDTALFATALDSMGVRFYGARHENIAISMAEGYAYAAGRLGVAVIGRGPALANGLHAAVYASRTGSPLLIVYGEAATGAQPNGLGPDYKAFDGVGVMRAAGVRAFSVTSPQSARAVLGDAARTALAGGTVSLHLPTNVQLSDIEHPAEPLQASAPEAKPMPASPQSIAAATAVLAKATRPLIVAGLGAHRAGAREAIAGLAERIGALIVTTARGKDLFAGNPNNLGIIGSFSHSIARRMAEQADCVLVFGAGLNFLTTSFGTSLPQVPLIQVDRVRANIGRWLNADVGLVGDARLVAEQLAAALPERAAKDKPFHAEATRKLIAAFDPAKDFQAANTARTLDPRTLAIELEKLLPRNRNLVVDGGNFLGVVPYLSVPDPGSFKMISDFASIGLGFGAALGVARGRPDRTTVLVIGDGGFLMTMGELETIVREDLPMVVVLMNDCAYGAELHFLKLRQQPVGKSVFPDVDFAPIAAGFGFETATIRTLEDLRAFAPKLARPEGPILIDCKINADVAAPFMSEFAHFEGRH